MFMRFGRRGPGGGTMQGELRIAYERRTTHGVERVRLTRTVVVAYDAAVKARLENAGRYLLANVALPRRRVNTEATVQEIIAVLNAVASASNNDWQLLNPSRVFRRRRTSVRPTYRTMYGVDAAQPERRHTIHSYSHKPTPRFKVGGGEDGSASAFFGVELEIDQQNTMLDRYAVPDLAHPLFYCKEDGSLDNGVEMVSHPGTAKWWGEQRGNVESLLQRLSTMGWRSHETKTCGMHVHVSNTAFENSMHMYRFLHLIYRYPTLALLVSQRERRRLNQWATLRYSKKPQLKQKALMRLKGREWVTADSAGHYDAVNKTSHTMELRIFNGTLNPSRFYKNLQFAEAAVRFTADTLNLRKVNALRFAEYVAANVEKYPDLALFFAEHSTHAALTNKRADKKALGFSEAA
jgi:hypothetical protein